MTNCLSPWWRKARDLKHIKVRSTPIYGLTRFNPAWIGALGNQRVIPHNSLESNVTHRFFRLGLVGRKSPQNSRSEVLVKLDPPRTKGYEDQCKTVTTCAEMGVGYV